MGSVSEQMILEELRDLPPDKWGEVRDFIGYLKSKQLEQPRRGSMEALKSSYGAWKMSPEERAEIEQMLDEARHLEEET